MHDSKRRLKRLASLAAGAAVVLVPAAPAAAAPAPVTCGAVLTASTTLHADLICTGDALVIGADGITLNLGGHTVRGSGTGTGIGISTRTNITVKNGTVSGFRSGAEVDGGSSFVTFTRVALSAGALTVDESTDVTFTHGSLGAVTAIDANRVTVTHSQVSGGFLDFVSTITPVLTHDTITDAPMNLSEVADAVISDCVLVRSQILIGITDKSVVRHNRISGAANGVYIQDSADHISVLDNTFENNQVGTTVKT